MLEGVLAGELAQRRVDCGLGAFNIGQGDIEGGRGGSGRCRRHRRRARFGRVGEANPREEGVAGTEEVDVAPWLVVV